jgi:hypothetical protein
MWDIGNKSSIPYNSVYICAALFVHVFCRAPQKLQVPLVNSLKLDLAVN